MSGNVALTLAKDARQYCNNVVAMLGFWWKYNVGTTFTQCCLKVISMPANVSQCCKNVGAMIGFRWKDNYGTPFTRSCLDIHTILLGCLEASANERCQNVGKQR